MLCHENCLPADDCHKIACLINFVIFEKRQNFKSFTKPVTDKANRDLLSNLVNY